ncbi:MAG TPA: response regulator [Verrucomicrobiae bacterium]
MSTPGQTQATTQILVVDDEPTVHVSIEAILGYGPYRLVHADNAQAALKIYAEGNIDLVLLDVMMPGMTGLEACKKICAQKPIVPVPVILMSALNSEDVIVDGLAAGATDFVTKPFRLHELRARVQGAARLRLAFLSKHHEMQKRQELISMVVHDIRGPLTIFRGFTALLQENLLEAGDIARYTKTLNFECDRIASMVNDMLMIALNDREGLQLEIKQQNLVPLVNRLISSHRSIATASGINLIFAPSDSNILAECDQMILERCLENLILNAIKHSQGPSSIDISLEQNPDHIQITVRDHGPGISPEYQQQIFNLFSMGAGQRKGKHGYGIGLAFCKLAMDEHQGSISVTNALGGGAEFKLTFPKCHSIPHDYPIDSCAKPAIPTVQPSLNSNHTSLCLD